MRWLSCLLFALFSPWASAQVGTVTVVENTSGTVTVSSINRNAHAVEIVLAVTADSAGSATATIQSYSAGALPDVVWMDQVITVASDGDTSPTDDWDMTIVDADGLDVIAAGGADRDEATAERIVPRVAGSVSGSWARIYAGGALSLAFANMGDSNAVVVKLILSLGP